MAVESRGARVGNSNWISTIAASTAEVIDVGRRSRTARNDRSRARRVLEMAGARQITKGIGTSSSRQKDRTHRSSR